MSAPRFSVILCSIDAYKFAQASACYSRLLSGLPFEIIGIHDALSLAEGYNRGLRQCRGEIVVFSHDDVLFLDRQFARKIGERMQRWDVLGFAGSTLMTNPPTWFRANWPYLRGAVCHWSRMKPDRLVFTIYGAGAWPVTDGIQTLDGLCLIARREVAASIGFDDETFDGWHLYDCDFSFAASLAGYKVGVCCDLPYIHASTSLQTSENVYASDVYRKYAERFSRKYLGNQLPECPPCPMQGIAIALRDHPTLTRLWNETTFRRVTLAIARGCAARGFAAFTPDPS
ncbi:MAG: glycosyltransferase family protein [Azoarcus sp.]|jgi:GT2 family glycosyltransferase|nr:glycosyltransferase family protein [Azoarcus sp.]